MKRAISLLLCALCLCLTLPGCADGPRYASTASFLMALEEAGIAHELVGLSDAGEEHVHLPGDGEHLALATDVFFSPDGDLVTIRVENLIAFDAADALPVLKAVNELNFSYKYVRFFAREDGAVACAMSIILHEGGDAGAITLEGLMRMDSILRHAMPQLEAYGKQ